MHIIKSSKLFIQNFTLSTALQSPLERVAFTTFRLPLKYRFSLNQAKRMSAFRSRFDQLLYEHFYDARSLQHFFFLALTTAEPLTCHLRQQPHPLTVMRSRRAVMSLGLFTDSLHLRCSASQLVHEMRRPRNFQ